MCYTDIVKNGTFYYPATNHYADEHDIVICDRCACEAGACIGYEKRDLCLPCANIVCKEDTDTDMDTDSEELSFMMQDMF